jgi:regulatory protein
LTALESAKAEAYRLIARRMRTRKEIQSRLRQQGHREEVVEETIKSLHELGYVDDAAFALEWCRCRLEDRPLGRRGLLRELSERGVPREIAEGAVNEAFASVEESQLAEGLIRRRAEHGVDLRSPRDTRRLKAYLLRRGFSIDSVKEALAAAAGPQTQDPPDPEAMSQEPPWDPLEEEIDADREAAS